jgi:8-oxo-dGTP pyrophosphatase MutT (NUDIX family)
VPAGKFENDLDRGSYEACALRETREEAGVDCEILLDLGWYRGTALKDNMETRTNFFAMCYVSDCKDWQEEQERQRCWHRLDEAISLVEWSPLLKAALEHVQEQYLLQLPRLLLERAARSQEAEDKEVEEPQSDDGVECPAPGKKVKLSNLEESEESAVPCAV